MEWFASFQQAFYYVCGPLAVFLWSIMVTVAVGIALYLIVTMALR